VSLLIATVCLCARAAAQEGRSEELGDAGPTPPAARSQIWEQAWKLDISRGGSAPLVWADSLLLVASLDRNLHWISIGSEPRIEFKENYRGGFSAAPVVTPRRIFLPELESGGRLVAVDRSTREIAWTVDAGDLAASPVVEGNRIYTVSSLGELVAWSDDGTELWRTDLETRVTSRPALLGAVVLVASTDGRVHAVDASDGTLEDVVTLGAGPIWGDPVVLPDGAAAATAIFATLGGQVLELGPDLTIVRQRSFPSRFFAGPTRAGDRLYLAGHEGTIWCYDWETDAIDWRLDLDDATVRMAPAVGEAHLAVGDLQGNLAIIDRASGTNEWSTRVDGALTSTPLFRGNQLFAISEQGTLYAFRPVAP
jgi:outer membrane protein assembly factor BamB